MNISRVFFLIFSCLFSFSVFSDDGIGDGGQSGEGLILPEEDTVLNLCFDQLLQRRLSLQEEMVTVRAEMKNAENKETIFTDYANRIHDLMLRANVLIAIEFESIDLSNNTCDEFIDKAHSDFETKMAAIEDIFFSFEADTRDMVEYKLREDTIRRTMTKRMEEMMRRLMDRTEDDGRSVPEEKGIVDQYDVEVYNRGRVI